jgi:hypothetical protein
MMTYVLTVVHLYLEVYLTIFDHFIILSLPHKGVHVSKYQAFLYSLVNVYESTSSLSSLKFTFWHNDKIIHRNLNNNFNTFWVTFLSICDWLFSFKFKYIAKCKSVNITLYLNSWNFEEKCLRLSAKSLANYESKLEVITHNCSSHNSIESVWRCVYISKLYAN